MARGVPATRARPRCRLFEHHYAGEHRSVGGVVILTDISRAGDLSKHFKDNGIPSESRTAAEAPLDQGLYKERAAVFEGRRQNVAELFGGLGSGPFNARAPCQRRPIERWVVDLHHAPGVSLGLT